MVHFTMIGKKVPSFATHHCARKLETHFYMLYTDIKEVVWVYWLVITFVDNLNKPINDLQKRN